MHAVQPSAGTNDPVIRLGMSKLYYVIWFGKPNKK